MVESRPFILVADDDPVQRRLLRAALERGGFAVREAADGARALDGLRAGGVALVVLDLVMPGGPDGLDVLAAMRREGLSTPVVVQTAQGGIDTAVAAMRGGAFDFVVKPVSPDKLLGAVGRALKVERAGPAPRAATPGLDDAAGAGPAMARALQLARKAAQGSIPVLIEGESGTGKEVLARAIQAAGPRRNKPFVTVNCGAIPEALVESILFGHEKGAFTGATERRSGKFADADGGTLFLDEVGDLPLDAQVKLLRAVQEGEIDPVGGRGSRRVDIRLITATHRDLSARVAEGRFREDLFYRLHVFPIRLPPLRERAGEIPRLVRGFIGQAAAVQPGARVRAIGSGALALLEAHDWPGNIRELENAVFRACVLCEGDTLGEEEFPQIAAQLARAASPPVAASDAMDAEPSGEPPPMPNQGGALRALDEAGEVRTLAAVEAEMVRFAVARYEGQMSEVARRLGIGRSTLYRKLRELGLETAEMRSGPSGSDRG